MARVGLGLGLGLKVEDRVSPRRTLAFTCSSGESTTVVEVILRATTWWWLRDLVGMKLGLALGLTPTTLAPLRLRPTRARVRRELMGPSAPHATVT